MRKTSLPLTLLIVTLFSLVTACKKDPPPLSERIAKVWTVQSAKENGSVVYTRGVTNPAPIRPGYNAFRLDLSAAPTVRWTQVDNNTFQGQYSVPNENTLRLTGLTPQPTGTNGSVDFTINSITDNQLVITETTANQKTGSTINEYTLSPQ